MLLHFTSREPRPEHVCLCCVLCGSCRSLRPCQAPKYRGLLFLIINYVYTWSSSTRAFRSLPRPTRRRDTHSLHSLSYTRWLSAVDVTHELEISPDSNECADHTRNCTIPVRTYVLSYSPILRQPTTGGVAPKKGLHVPGGPAGDAAVHPGGLREGGQHHQRASVGSVGMKQRFATHINSR